VTGIAGIAVLPGLILGILGLRRARSTGQGRARSWLGIAASLVWATGIIVVATGALSTPADPGCDGYQSGGQADAAKVSSALGARAPASQLGSDLRQASSKFNSATARAQSLAVRNALSTMTDDLQSTLDQVTAGHQTPSADRIILTRDTAAVTRLCGHS
jgi:hypothetical protein